MNLRMFSSSFCATLIFAFAYSLMGQEVLFETTKLIPGDGALWDNFGRSVDVDDGIVLVGSPLDEIGAAEDSGSAYLFDAQTGEQLRKLIVPSNSTQAIAGQSVAIRQSMAVVGVPNAFPPSPTGGAIVFDVNDQSSTETLEPFTPAAFSVDFSNYGFSVSMSDDGSWLAIGARGDTGTNTMGANGGGGAMYIYSPDGNARKVYSDDAEFGDNFGHAVASTNSFTVGSSPFDDDLGDDSGAIYVFDNVSGQQVFKLTADDGRSDDFFGSTLAAHDQLIVSGAPFRGDPNSGAAFLFNGESGEQISKLEMANSFAFGISVDIDAERIAIAEVGVAYIYDIESLDLIAELRPSDVDEAAAIDNFFGNSIAINGDMVVVGSELDDVNGVNSGSAYVFDLSEMNVVMGDINGDGLVNLLDVGAFVELLTSGEFQVEADINGDGSVDLLDVEPFVELLAG